MGKIILTAENFAFGPIGKLLDVAVFLKEMGHNLTFAGFGTSLQLARRFPFDGIVDIDTDKPDTEPRLREIILTGDVLVSSMDIPSVLVAKKLRVPIVWIDCLFWFWDSIPDEILGSEVYIKENLIDDKSNFDKYSSKILNLIEVGPIIGVTKKVVRENRLLISYGGGEAAYWYRAGKDTNYPYMMTNILVKSLDFQNYDRVTIATNERVAEELKKKFSRYEVEFACLPHDEFLSEMARSRAILITPGLVTAEAAFYSETPTIFLPPSNNSQYLQLDEFRQEGVADASVHLLDYLPAMKLRGIPLKESTKMMLDQLRQLDTSPDIQDKIGRRVRELLDSVEYWSPESVEKGRRYLGSKGENGALTAATKISELISANQIS